MQLVSAQGLMFANNAEAALWSLVAAALILAWVRCRSLDRFIAVLAFLIFSAAQWVDVATTLRGAWALVAVKAACMAAFTVLLWRYERARREGETQEA